MCVLAGGGAMKFFIFLFAKVMPPGCQQWDNAGLVKAYFALGKDYIHKKQLDKQNFIESTIT